MRDAVNERYQITLTPTRMAIHCFELCIEFWDGHEVHTRREFLSQDDLDSRFDVIFNHGKRMLEDHIRKHRSDSGIGRPVDHPAPFGYVEEERSDP
jgi:hypothetical protein